MAKKKTEKIENPSVLAFEAKLVLSDALMKSGNWDDRNNADKWKSIKVDEIRARGTISNRMKAEVLNNPAKLEQKINEESIKPNPLLYDKASLPFDVDTLKVSFSLRVIGNLKKPTACNNPEYEEKLSKIIDTYIDTYGFKELSKRYAQNIANGRFLWRNRLSAESIEIHVTAHGKKLIFDAYQVGMNNFSQSSEDLESLTSIIESGLNDSTQELFTFIEVDAFVKMGKGQQIYPSQKMNMETKKGEKSKFLFKINEKKENETAGMHSQKIGNALRTIDDWHSLSDRVGAIAIEPYGSVTSRGQAYRTGNDNFYSILDNWMKKDKVPSEDEQHYIMAVLIRGGVFSE